MQIGSDSFYNFVPDLGLSDFQVQVVVGSVYTFTNGFSNLFFGVLADWYPRKWIWIGACLLWTGCTFAESYATNFTQLLLARIGFALAMGSCVPLCVSLLSDYTMPKDRGIAQSLFAAGVYLGVGMSSISVIIDNNYGYVAVIKIFSDILLYHLAGATRSASSVDYPGGLPSPCFSCLNLFATRPTASLLRKD